MIPESLALTPPYALEKCDSYLVVSSVCLDICSGPAECVSEGWDELNTSLAVRFF